MQREGTLIHLSSGLRVQKWRRAFFTFLRALSSRTTLVYIRMSYVEINSVYSFYFCPGVIWTITKIIHEPSDVRKCSSPSRSQNAARGLHPSMLVYIDDCIRLGWVKHLTALNFLKRIWIKELKFRNLMLFTDWGGRLKPTLYIVTTI